jgi:hypothetical protein
LKCVKRMTTTIKALSVPVLLAFATACGDDLLLPRDGEPARVSPVNATALVDTVGQALEDSLVVEVTDPGGRPVSGVKVTFILPEGAVAAPSDTVHTGSDGRAAVAYTLGTVAGEQAVQARAPIEPETNAVATFRVSALPDVPQSLRMVDGDSQNAQVSTVLPESLVVRAEDRFGNGVAGIEVTWEAIGGGEVSPVSVITGADGRAATARTLGDRPGTYGAVATAELEGSPVAFTATAIAAPRPELVLIRQPSSTAVAGQPLGQQPEIQLQDPFGAPLNQEGVRVTVQIAEGGGSLGGGTSARSDASGRVTFTNLELQGEIGTKTLIFAADGFTPITSTPIVVEPGPPDPDESSVSVPNGTAGSETAISIRLRDEFENEITGAAGDLAIRITGANPVEGLSVTDLGSGSYSASYVPVHSGVDEVVVEFRGMPLVQEPSSVSAGAADPTTTTATLTRNFFSVDVIVTTRDAYGNPLGRGGDQVHVQGSIGDPQLAEDAGDGTYRASVVVVFGGTVAISLNGVPLSGSPFEI